MKVDGHGLSVSQLSEMAAERLIQSYGQND